MPIVNEDEIRRSFDGAKAEFGIFSDQIAKFLRIGSGDTSAVHLAGAAAQDHIEKLLSLVPAGDDTDITEEEATVSEHHHGRPVVKHIIPEHKDKPANQPSVPPGSQVDNAVKPNPVGGAGTTVTPGAVVQPKSTTPDDSTKVTSPPAGGGAQDSKSPA